jgi:hypothetical protein
MRRLLQCTVGLEAENPNALQDKEHAINIHGTSLILKCVVPYTKCLYAKKVADAKETEVEEFSSRQREYVMPDLGYACSSRNKHLCDQKYTSLLLTCSMLQKKDEKMRQSCTSQLSLYSLPQKKGGKVRQRAACKFFGMQNNDAHYFIGS